MTTEEKERRLLAYALYTKLLGAARHHGMLQTNYRLIASTWLLATFAAIGFILSAQEILPFNDYLSVAIISVIGEFALIILWYEDSVIQELLLRINVIEGIHLEQKEPWLPQLHTTFVEVHHTHGIQTVKRTFFLGCKSILMTSSIISLVLYLYKVSIFLTIASAIVLLLANYFISRMMIRKGADLQGFMEFIIDNR